MKTIHIQLTTNGRRTYATGTDLDEELEEFNRFQITELFRAVLLRIEPSGCYRLDITKRPEPEPGLPT